MARGAHTPDEAPAWAVPGPAFPPLGKRLDSIGFYCTVPYIGSMPAALRATVATGKTTTLTFRIEPGLNQALRTAAAREHRFIANMAEVLIRDYCGRNGTAIPEQQTPRRRGHSK